MAMCYEMQTDGELSTVRFSGKLDVGSATELLQIIRDVAHYTLITVDLRATEFIDVAAVQILLALHRLQGKSVSLLIDESGPAAAWLQRGGLLESLGITATSAGCS